MSLQDHIRQYVALVAEKRGHQERLREIEQELTRLTTPIIEGFADQGIENQRVRLGEDSYTITTKAVVRARPKAEMTSALALALEAAGHGDLVKASVHAGTLTAWVKEMMEDGGIPQGIEPYIEIAQYRDISVTHVAASHK